MPRLRLTALVCVLTLAFAAPAVRAEAPRAPEGAEILVQGRLLPPPEETRRLLERLKGYALVERGLEMLHDEHGIDVERDILSWVEGSAMAAIIRTGEESPLSRAVRSGELETKYSEFDGQLQLVFSALLSYQDIQGKPPETLQQLIPDYLSEGFDLSQMRYTRQGKGWTLTGAFPEGSDLAASGATPPVLDQDGNRTEGKRPPEPRLNFVVAVKVTDPALAARKVREILAKAGEAPSGDGPMSLPGDDDTVLDVRNGWIIAADDATLLPRASAALSGKSPVPANLARMLRQVPENPDLFLYVDVPDIVAHWRGLEIEDERLRQALGSVKGAVLATYADDRRMITDSFIALEPPAGHPLATLLQGDSENRLTLLRRVPWSVSYIDVLQVNELWRAADDVARLHPYLEYGVKMVEETAQETLGLSIEKDLLPASTGEVALNLEAVDVFSAGILSWFDEMQKSEVPVEEESAPAPEAESGSEPAKEAADEKEAEVEKTTPPEPDMQPLPDTVPPPPGLDEDELKVLKNLPMTLVVGLRSGPARQRILQSLEEKIGADGRRIPYRGGDIRQRKDRAFAYTLRGDYLVVSVGPTLRLMKAMVDGMTGQVPPVAELKSYQEFRSGLKGRVLAFRHTKTDAIYSIAKGMLLFLGAEFRHEADALGLWRDAYAAWSVEPGGLRLRGGVYATDQVP